MKQILYAYIPFKLIFENIEKYLDMLCSLKYLFYKNIILIVHEYKKMQ